MARRPRLAAQAAAASFKTPVPQLSDDEMVDASPSDAMTPRDNDDEPNQDDEEEEEPEDVDGATPGREGEASSRHATPRRIAGRSTSLVPRKRRLGRPPKNRLAGSDDDAGDAASDAATPKRRGGFRGHRGGRWSKPRGGPSHTTQVPIDKEGNMLDVIDDEVNTPEDPEGETKVDKMGNLQDGREYRVRIFTLLGRGKRQYMLSTEPARCIGFRDSYLFFQKHKLLYKIIIDDDEKRDLIQRNVIPHSYKGRAIGVVTARSVFREFGAKIVIAGKKVTDDYYVQACRGRGDVEGELACPEDVLPLPGHPYNRNQYVAWHGASAVYHSGAPSVPLPSGKVVEGKKRKIAVTSDNWMLEHAREASRFNGILVADRKTTLKGLYDIHTNIVQWPENVQPTHARWEPVEPNGDQLANGASKLANGPVERSRGELDGVETPTTFPQLEPVYARNFMIHDIYLDGAPDASLGRPGPRVASNDLASISNDILDELPPECRQVFDEAKERELNWRSRWLTEETDGMRAHFLPTTAWYP